MSVTDPGILALALIDLQEELVRWGGSASESIHVAEETQRNTMESVDRMLHRARIVQEQAQRNFETCQNTRDRRIALVHQCEDAIATSKVAQQTAEQLHSLAQRTVRDWLQKLSAAQAWLARAEHRLELALQELADAESDLRSAEWHLNSAESRLRA